MLCNYVNTRRLPINSTQVNCGLIVSFIANTPNKCTCIFRDVVINYDAKRPRMHMARVITILCEWDGE